MALSFSKIRKAIEEKLEAEWDAAANKIAWENTNFDAASETEIYIAPTVAYLNSLKLEAGIGGSVQINGILRCDVVGSRQSGMSPIEDVADLFIGMFNEISLTIDAERYAFFRQASLNGPYSDENRATLQVIIPFICIQKGG